jgi:hypothetical protein
MEQMASCLGAIPGTNRVPIAFMIFASHAFASVMKIQMKKEMEEHLDRMWDRGDINRAKLVDEIGEIGEIGAREYILNLILTEDPQEEHYSGVGLEARALYNSKEAFSIINALQEIAQSYQQSICVKWEQEKSNGKKLILKKYSSKMSRAEMIQRLEWITSERYSDDIELWLKWVAFREENGFMRSR